MNNVNAALDKFPELKSLGIVDLNAKVGGGELPAEIATVVRNNGGELPSRCGGRGKSFYFLFYFFNFIFNR